MSEAIGITRDEYKRVAKMIRSSPTNDTILKSKVGDWRVYFSGSQLKGDKLNEEGTVEKTQEIVNIDDLAVETFNSEANRKELWDKLKEAYPQGTDEEIEALIDIMYEAQRSMVSLIHSGVDAEIAKNAVLEGLKGDFGEKKNEVLQN